MMNNFKTLPWEFNFEDIDLIKQVNKTNIALWKLNWSSLTLPNSKVLIDFVTMKEWVISNEIENVHTTVADAFASEIIWKDLASFENKETLNYKEAIITWFDRLKKYQWVWYNDILEINKIITWNNQWVYSSPNKKIEKWEWKNKEVIYTPPQGLENIKNLLKNYEEYFNAFDEEKEIDPLLKLPLLHYQFEAIHPFWDWNWRTWRILIILFLVLHSKLSLPILFISDFINLKKNEYYKHLNILDTEKEEKLKEFTLWLLKWIEDYSIKTEETILGILKLQKTYKNIIKEDKELNKFYSRDLIDYLFMRPIYSIEWLSKYLEIHTNTASKYLKLLKEKWMIEEYKYKNNKLFFNENYLDLLK